MSNHFSDYHNYDFYHHEKKEIECEVDYCDEITTEIDGHIITRPGVKVTCLECNHSVESLGQSDRSIRRYLALLCDECPQVKKNCLLVYRGK